MLKEITKAEDLTKCLQENSLVIIDFFAEWCGPCKLLAPQFKKASEMLDDVLFVKINIDDASELAQDYNVLSIPTLVIVKNGAVVERNNGFVSSDFIVDWINKHR